MTPPGRFEVRASPWKSAGTVVALGTVAALSVELFARGPWPGWRVVGLLAVPAAAACVPRAVRRLVDRSPHVVISDDGILAGAFGFPDTVPWSAVERITALRRVGGSHQAPTRLLILNLHDPAPYLSRLPASAARALLQRYVSEIDVGHLTLPFEGLSPGLTDAVNFITGRLGFRVEDRRP